MLECNIYPGPKQTLVLLPAFPFSNEMWLPLIEQVKDQFTILALDYPGFGLMQRPNSTGWTFPMMSDEIKNKIQSLRISKVILCGISMGGYAALDFVGRYPEFVEGLVLANTQAGSDTDEAIEGRNKMIRQILNGSVEAFSHDFLDKIFSQDRALKFPSEIDFLKNLVQAQSPAAIINALIAMCARGDSTAKLAKISVPSLVITGTEDFLIPEARSAEIHKGIAGSQLEIMNDTGHLSVVEAPSAFAQLLCTFAKTIYSKNEGAFNATEPIK